ncbi:MAP9 protein, partial [Mystacornis crossleyi]|nr:MAP9 protein [Mystacornis crossleyi]
DELQEAILDYATSKETDEYSDDFESDEDGMLNDIRKELAESNSGSTSTEKSIAGSPLLNDNASQEAIDLENEAADDLNLSFHEKKLQQIMVLEGENIQNDRKDGEEGYLKGQNEDNNRKNNEEHSAAEEVLCDNELHTKGNQEENQPKAKPRMHRKGKASAAGEKKLFECCCCLTMVGQQQEIPFCLFLSEDDNQLFRSLKSISLSVHVHGRCERAAKMPSQYAHGTESCVHIVSTASMHPLMERSLNSFSMTNVSTSDHHQEDSGRKSPSVIEQVRTTIYEKTKALEQPAADVSDGMVKIAEGEIITDTMQEVSVNDKSEHGEAKNTSKNSVKEHYLVSATITGKVINVFVSWYFPRSTSFVHLKKKGKTVPSTSPVSSQYLGSLKVLESKCMPEKSPEFNKVDNIRATVFQNWLEKKRLLLMELKRSEKEKAEILRKNTEKKEALKREESIACFEAWKKKKEKEAKKLSEKKKLEELEEKTPAEQNKEKTEAAQAAFKKWNERKVEFLREQSRKEKQCERMRKKIQEDLVAEKRRVSVSAVEKW